MDRGKSDILARPPSGRLDRLTRELLHKPTVKGERPDWISLAMTSDQVLESYPDDVHNWTISSWNLAYNAPVDFEGAPDKYWWKKQGIMVLIAGSKINPSSGDMLFSLAWTVGMGIGGPDDARQYRRLFADDKELQVLLLSDMKRQDVLGPTGKPDNWLIARQWLLRAIPLLTKEFNANPKQVLHGPLIFLSQPAMYQTKFAVAIEKEGFFGDAAKAWAEAERDWIAFGDRDILMSKGIIVRLNTLAELEEESKRLREELNKMVAEASDPEPAWQSRLRFGKPTQKSPLPSGQYLSRISLIG